MGLQRRPSLPGKAGTPKQPIHLPYLIEIYTDYERCISLYTGAEIDLSARILETANAY